MATQKSAEDKSTFESETSLAMPEPAHPLAGQHEGLYWTCSYPSIPLVNADVHRFYYEDTEYFTGAFPTLFPYGREGHIPLPVERGNPVSLEAWARWTLSHHSRRSVVTCIMLYGIPNALLNAYKNRFAQHPTFMYLLYDVIQRRKAALGNS
jgi:hypothetical protein